MLLNYKSCLFNYIITNRVISSSSLSFYVRTISSSSTSPPPPPSSSSSPNNGNQGNNNNNNEKRSGYVRENRYNNSNRESSSSSPRTFSRAQWSEPVPRTQVSELVKKGVISPEAPSYKPMYNNYNNNNNNSSNNYNSNTQRSANRYSSPKSKEGGYQQSYNKPRYNTKPNVLNPYHGITPDQLVKMQEILRKEEQEEKDWMPKENDIEIAKYSENDKLLSSKEHLKKTKTEFMSKARRHTLDSGSSESQIAAMTSRILHLQQHMKSSKKDHHSRRGLMLLIENRRKQMKYLFQKDRETYDRMVSMFSLRHLAGANPKTNKALSDAKASSSTSTIKTSAPIEAKST